MASINDYDSDLAGDTVTATAKKKQNTFDQSNLPAQYQAPAPTAVPAAATPPAPLGPVGRVAQQLPAAPGAAPSQSLESLRPTSIGDGRSAIFAGVGANGEASFSNAPSSMNSLTKNFTAPNQGGSQRLSSLSDLTPGGAPPIQSSVPQPQASLGDAWRGGTSTGPGFARLGSASNLGDGVGTFSQSQSGDSALALGRFQRANDLRQGYQDQDRLNNAVAENTRANHTTIVRDSSQPITRADVYRDHQDQLAAQGRLDNIASAQNVITGRQQVRGTDQALQRNARLEDIMSAGQSANATPDQRAALQRLLDPDGTKALGRTLTQAQINEKNASADKLRSEANPQGGPKLTEGQSKDYNYYERGNAANGELAGNSAALTGVTDSLIRSIPVLGHSGIGNALVSKDRQMAEQSGNEFINSLLRKDSGAALTREEQEIYGKTYLPQPGDSQEVIQQKANARTRSLQSIRGGLGNASSITSPVNQGGAAPAGKAGPAVGTVMQGHVFLGGDPASPSSWRKQ